MEPIAIFHSPFKSKFGIPRQSGLVKDLKGTAVFLPKFRNADAVRGLEQFDYIWLLWEFSANRRFKDGSVSCGTDVDSWQPTVRPPRLGGNKSMGVFATRSPFRPNPIGLSSVRIDFIEKDTPQGPLIHTLGADLMDGTPILDIKPYIAYADSHEEARCGFVDSLEDNVLDVRVPDKYEVLFDSERFEMLRNVLSLDPRPAYQEDPEKTYGMPFEDYDVHFKVDEGVLTVVDIARR